MEAGVDVHDNVVRLTTVEGDDVDQAWMSLRASLGRLVAAKTLLEQMNHDGLAFVVQTHGDELRSGLEKCALLSAELRKFVNLDYPLSEAAQR